MRPLNDQDRVTIQNWMEKRKLINPIQPMEDLSPEQKEYFRLKTAMDEMGQQVKEWISDGNNVCTIPVGKDDEFRVQAVLRHLLNPAIIVLALLFSGCNKEEPYTPEFCQCHEEHEMTLNGVDWYPYPSANTDPQDGFCDQASTEYIYQSSDHRFKEVCQ